jgi:hypothetical protein
MQRTAAQTSPAGERATDRKTWRRWAAVPAIVVTAAALFAVNLKLSGTSPMNSDSANVLLMGWDMLHGNPLLHGWYATDVSIYTTEVPQYALLSRILGVHPETTHVAAAMTYTLATLLAMLLAKGGTSGRTALVRMAITGGIMVVAPQLGAGVYALVMVVDHIGTSVPLLVIWLLLDRFDRSAPRWWVPVLTMILLTWVLIADPIVLVMGVAPLTLVSGIRFIQGVAAGRGAGWTQRIRAQWYELALACSAAAAVPLALLAERALRALGGIAVDPYVFGLKPWNEWRNDILALWRVVQLYGADYRGLTGAAFAFAVLHLVSVALVCWAMLRVARRFFSGIPLVDQVLAVAIGMNVVLYAISDVSIGGGAHEIAIIAPFGAALAARALAGPAYRPGQRRPTVGVSASRLRLPGLAAGVLVLAGYLAGLGYELSQPAAPPDNATVASWLAAHHLTYGLAGYWQASSVTVDSGGEVVVRALPPHSTQPYLWLAKASWYDPASHWANFIVIDNETTRFATWLPLAAIEKDAGVPARTYHTGPYTIMVWNKNLLASLAG